MADEIPVEIEVNGIGYSATEESFYDADQTAELIRKMEALEQEKRKLASENEEVREKAKKMAIEIEKIKIAGEDKEAKLKAAEEEIERSAETERATAARVAAMEAEIARLQHDLNQAMSASEEADAKLFEISRASNEKSATIEALKRELESSNVVKAEIETELEKKVVSLEAREVRADELARASVGEKEKEIGILKRTVAELEIAASSAEERARALESKVAEAMSNAANAAKEIFEVDDDEDEDRTGGSEWHTVAMAAGAGAAVVAGLGLICVVYARRR